MKYRFFITQKWALHFPENATACKNIFSANIIIQSSVVSSYIGLEKSRARTEKDCILESEILGRA